MPSRKPNSRTRPTPARLPRTPEAILAELVAIPSVAPDTEPDVAPRGERALGDWIASYLRRLGADVSLVPAIGDRCNLIARFTPSGRARARCAFMPHLDTVGVTGMTVPPFTLTRGVGGRLHGRGACDTKGPTASLLSALHRFSQSRDARSDIEWIVAATVGEEAGALGAEALMASGFRADFAIALEPTGRKVVHAAKGVLRVAITVPGRAAHGATPERGTNAIFGALPLLKALRDEFAPALARRRHPDLGPPTMNLGRINGGTQINIVPDACELQLDLRCPPNVSRADVLAELRALVRRLAPKAKLRELRWGPAFSTDKTNPWVTALHRCGTGWDTAHWYSDANVVASHGIPAVAFGPGHIRQAHTRDEWISRQELDAGADAFLRFLSSPPTFAKVRG